jgi:UPF0716 protein FxsA
VLLRLIMAAVLIPLVELVLLTQLNQRTGIIGTVGIILVTGVVGAWLAKRQGRAVWQQIHQQLSSGKTPSRAITEGVMILIAGALLITPGLLTDVLGLLLLVPAFRAAVARRLTAWFLKRTEIKFRSTSFVHEPLDPSAATDPSQPHAEPSVRVVDPDATRISR